MKGCSWIEGRQSFWGREGVPRDVEGRHSFLGRIREISPSVANIIIGRKLILCSTLSFKQAIPSGLVLVYGHKHYTAFDGFFLKDNVFFNVILPNMIK